MNLDLTNYLKIYPFFDKVFCSDVVEKLKYVDWFGHKYVDTVSYQEVTYENELMIASGDFDECEQIMKGIWDAYHRYLNELQFEWFQSWAGFSQVRFNKYDVNTLMREHCDHIVSLFDGEKKGIPTMTALGALNDDYEGGELIFWQDKQIVIPPGHIAVFPSNFLYPHKVNPVTKGVRYSFVSWAW